MFDILRTFTAGLGRIYGILDLDGIALVGHEGVLEVAVTGV